MDPSRTIAYLNGKEIPLNKAYVSVTDRGFVFADAVYEVVRVYKGKPFLLEAHIKRLHRGLNSLEIDPITDIEEKILRNIVANNVQEGIIYLQISRGQGPRGHSYFDKGMQPNILIYGSHFDEHPFASVLDVGISAITHEDLRWARCDIKTVNLLPNCLAQSRANQMGYEDAILINANDEVTEATSSSLFLVKGGQIATPPLSLKILPGTRREFVINALSKKGYKVVERSIKKSELFGADELFLTSTTKEAIAITKLDDKTIGDGLPGPVAKEARQCILQHIPS